MSRVSKQNPTSHTLLLSPSSFAEASFHDPFLLQRFGHRCPFISSKAKAGRVLAGDLRCLSETLGSTPWVLGSTPWVQGCPSQAWGDRLRTSSRRGLETGATRAAGCSR